MSAKGRKKMTDNYAEQPAGKTGRTIADNLAAMVARKKNDSLLSFTRQAGVRHSTMVGLLNGDTGTPTLKTLLQLADALEMKIGDFVEKLTEGTR